MYAMGTNTDEVPELSKQLFSDQHLVCIQVDSMISALRGAVRAFFADAKATPDLLTRVKTASGKTYAKIPVGLYVKTVEEIAKLKASNKSLKADSSDEPQP
jgi:uncharacterized protein YpbB